MKTSSEPALGQVLRCGTTPGKCPGAWPGEILTSGGWPSPEAFGAARRTSPSEQLPPIHPQSLPSAVINALSPARADVGGSTRTTVATTNASPRSRSPTARSRTSSASDMTYSAAPFSFNAAQTLSDVTGISIFVMPRWATASITALTKAAGDPTVADSPTPLAPMGWWGEGVTVWKISNLGVSQDVGSR